MVYSKSIFEIKYKNIIWTVTGSLFKNYTKSCKIGFIICGIMRKILISPLNFYFTLLILQILNILQTKLVILTPVS